ncbi:MAG: hypothetical protein AAGI07_14550, partial [Bacteroidota bacterium]
FELDKDYLVFAEEHISINDRKGENEIFYHSNICYPNKMLVQQSTVAKMIDYIDKLLKDRRDK